MTKVNITEENGVLFTGYQKPGITQLGKDASNCAVLNCACSLTVCGKNWLRSYSGSLEEEDWKKITHNEGKKVFRFGGEEMLRSTREFKLLVWIVGKDIYIKNDVVQLLS